MAKHNGGDTVRLKSGGPLMTVEKYDDNNPTKVWCSWFNGAERKKELFQEDAVEQDEDTPFML